MVILYLLHEIYPILLLLRILNQHAHLPAVDCDPALYHILTIQRISIFHFPVDLLCDHDRNIPRDHDGRDTAYDCNKDDEKDRK